jgi:hypothetical protein
MWSTRYFCQNLMNLKFSGHIFDNYSNTKFYENPSSGSQVVPCEDRNDEANSRSSHFGECAWTTKVCPVLPLVHISLVTPPVNSLRRKGGGNNKNTNDTLRDVALDFTRAFFDFLHAARFQGTPVNLTSFTPIRKVLLSLRQFAWLLQMLSSILWKILLPNFKTDVESRNRN